MPHLALSSWSVHGSLGATYNKYHRLPAPRHDPANPFGELSLLELPAQMAARGIYTLEICHFHLPRLDDGYFAELKSELNSAGVLLYSILIDDADITNPNLAQQTADIAWIRSWIETAGRCGASKVRIIAGKQPADSSLSPHDDPNVQLSARHLNDFVAFGKQHNVGIITENFHALTMTPPPLLAILDLCEGQVGLCADVGNYKGDTKYDYLTAIFPHATSAHVKANFTQPLQPERTDFDRCLNIMAASHFDGPTTLIFDSAGNEWENLEVLQRIVEPYC
ncbi:MAG: sugar phosphate isomerase/epimerase [Chloroflexota bacterium]